MVLLDGPLLYILKYSHNLVAALCKDRRIILKEPWWSQVSQEVIDSGELWAMLGRSRGDARAREDESKHTSELFKLDP